MMKFQRMSTLIYRMEKEMEKFICTAIRIYKQIVDYFLAETRFGLKRSAFVIMLPIVTGFIVFRFNKEIAVKITLLTFLILSLLWCFIYPKLGTKIVHVISRGQYDKPEQLLKEMKHLSYIYGILISFDIECIIFLFVYVAQTILGRKANFPNAIILFCIIFLVFSFFYFMFHVYINPQKLELSKIEQRLQFYTAVATSISFILLLCDESGWAEKFIAGILLDYLWINYFISDKEKKMEIT